MSGAVEHPFQGMQAPPNYDPFEKTAVDTIRAHLNNPDNGPLLTIDEQDLLIDSETLYFGAINRRYTPHNALQRIREGTLTDKDVAHSQNAARAIVRGKKSDMYAERVMTATFAADTCRALYRVATSGEMTPVLPDDTVDNLMHRTSDYVADMLRAGRETRLLHGAAMLRTTDKIKEHFDTDLGATLDLTTLAGLNSMKKVALYIDRLHSVSRGYQRMTKESRDKLMTYIANRPPEFFDKPDLSVLLANKVKR